MEGFRIATGCGMYIEPLGRDIYRNLLLEMMKVQVVAGRRMLGCECILFI